MSFVAAEPRLTAAVLGLCGLTPGTDRVLTDAAGGWHLAPLMEQIAEAARRVRHPVLYHVQWDDQLFDHAGAFALYDLIGTPDKRLQSTPGLHAEYTAEAVDTMHTFLANRLRAAAPA